MRFAPFIILLGFPALEFVVGVQLARQFGWWLLAWLVCAAIAGLFLLREAGTGLQRRLVGALAQGESVVADLLASGRNLVAGLLLIFPGVVSDLIALTVLLLPAPGSQLARPSARGDGTIEGEFRRIHDRPRR